ncbi:hypothetical protein D3Z45_00685 [Lachnospiraceae bacterium]|nr:hypothetical protein [Lachnospiraceae bacterium]
MPGLPGQFHSPVCAFGNRINIMVKQCSINIQKNIFHLYIHAPFQNPKTIVRNANLRNANLRNANFRSTNLQIENLKFSI